MRLIFTSLIILIFSSSIAQNKTINKDWTAYSQSIDVSIWEESEFILSAYLKKEENGTTGKSALWVRVDKKDNSGGFFRNDAYDESKKVSSKWKKFEIKGKIDSGADKLYFGAFCQGSGNFYFDKFELQIKNKKGQWEDINIVNSSFEDVKLNNSWNEGVIKDNIINVKNFTITYSEQISYDGDHSLNIIGENIIGSNKNGKFIDVNNVRLYYEIYGKGKPLLMLHGNGQSISAFINQVDFFSKFYKVILVDCRGRGNSTFDYETELTYSLEANDINLFLDKINVKKTNIIGWSDGGNIGLIMAINYPEKVDKLVAIGANINPNGLKNLKGMHNTIEELEKNNKGDNDLFIALYKLMAYHPKLDYDDLKLIKSKTLIMAGDRDQIKNIHTIKMYESIKDAQLAILPNETHYFPEENPDFFNKLVIKFLKE